MRAGKGRELPEARSEVLGLTYSTATGSPGITLNDSLSPLAVVMAPLEALADAFRVTGPATLPVTVVVATPKEAAAEPRPVTEPVPESWAKVTASKESAPESTALPAASSIVAVTRRSSPDFRSAVEPESTILAASP